MSKVIRFVAPETIEDALNRIAVREGRNRSAVMRDLILNKAKEYGLWPPVRDDCLVDTREKYDSGAGTA